MFQKSQGRSFLQHFSFFCIFLLSFITVPVLLFTVIFFGTIRFFVKIILKIKHSKQFSGLLPGSDTIWTVKTSSQTVITTVAVIESKKTFKEFIEYVRNDVCSAMLNHPSNKMRCTRHRKFGYSFLLKSTGSLSDFQENFVRKIKIEGDFNQNSMKKIISDQCNKEMPLNNTALWEILVFDKEIEWNSNEKKHFVVGFRFHHCLADGIGLIKLLLEHFSDTKRVEKELSCIISTEKESLSKKFNKICQFLGAIAFGPAILLVETFLRPKDSNILHGCPLSGEKMVAFRTESQPEFVTMVKQIKTKFSTSGMRFSDVVIAGVAASFRDYYKKRGNIPEEISAVIPALLQNTNFYLNDKNSLKNYFTCGILNLPISKHEQEDLQEIHEKIDELWNSSEYAVNYYLLPVISAVLPEPLLRKMVESVHCTLLISCLPGTKKLNVFQGDELQDVIFWVPNMRFTGVGVSVLSYGGRFQIGLYVDKALISDEESAQEIVDGVFKHIRNMYNLFVL